jgi:penicillin-binding protein 1A
MRIALQGLPENQMPMPEGMVSVLIDRETGCPARAGQRNVIFEVFREGHVPVCDLAEGIDDPFNNTSGVDAAPVVPPDDNAAPTTPSEEPQEEAESLF